MGSLHGRVRTLLAGAVVAVLLAGCGSTLSPRGGAERALTAGIPVRSAAKPIGTGLERSTPDGGFYYSNVYVHVYYARPVPLSDVLPLLSGAERKDATSLAGLGPLLEVVARAYNSGASTSSVELFQAVLESAHTNQLVPQGAHRSIQQTYYRPIRPIVVLSNYRLNTCSASANPGGSVWLVAVFPPVETARGVALVHPNFGPAAHPGFYLRIARGALPTALPPNLYSQDVNGCLQTLAANS